MYPAIPVMSSFTPTVTVHYDSRVEQKIGDVLKNSKKSISKKSNWHVAENIFYNFVNYVKGKAKNR
tara:strand:- start:2661 stop:2858 length:198 start_codon:yes stop_codon:yes gene_type:complete